MKTLLFALLPVSLLAWPMPEPLPPEPLAACAPVGWVWFFTQTVICLITMGAAIISNLLLRDRQYLRTVIGHVLAELRQD